MPLLTQNAGIWIKYPVEQKYVSKMSFEKEVIKEIICKIPTVDYFSQNFHYKFNNWLPFYWSGYKQTTRYTYVLEDLSDINTIYMNLKDNIRREIKKAKKIVKISSSDSIAEFYKVNKLTFERQNLNIPYTLDLIIKIDKACEEHNCRKIFFAKDIEGNIHAAIYIVWDADSSYYLMGGGDPKFRTSGATSFLMWEAIKFSAGFTNKFDFEGSMMQPIERFFSAFGAMQKPYFNITKTNSRLLKIRNSLIEILK